MCFTCGGHGVIDKKDLDWKSKWAEGQPPERKRKGTGMRKTAVATKTTVAAKAPRKKIVKAEVPVVETGRTPLHQEATDGFIRGVKELLDSGADVNARDNNGRTPLHWPSYRGHLEVVQLLCEHGADVNAEDNEGRTPMRMATIGKHQQVVDFLRDHGGRM